jgi:AraC-like DNA-binding protein
MALAAIGVSGLLLPEACDRGSLVRSMLLQSDRDCVTQLLVARCGGALTGHVRSVVEHSLLADGRPSVETVAAAMSLHRATLSAHVAKSCALSPEQLIGWCRLLLAARWLEYTDFAVGAIASEFGFASGAALRGALVRYTGLRTAVVRAEGGFEAIVDVFSKSIERARAS